RDFFAALHRFEQERIAGALRDAQVGAHGCKQIRRKNMVNRNEVSLFGEAAELGKTWLNHGAVIVTLDLFPGETAIAWDWLAMGWVSVRQLSPKRGAPARASLGKPCLPRFHRDSSLRSWCKTARRIAASGARRLMNNSHCAKPCARNISTPETARI